MTKQTTESGGFAALQGQAAVWQVASQLALRGYVPYLPGVDYGCDLMLDSGLRLQVKCASLRENNQKSVIQKNFGYYFDLRRGAWLTNERRWKKSSLRPYSEVADYFVLWGIEENRFFIVPTSHKRQRIWFISRNAVPSKSNNRKLFDRITADRVREFEERWDLLDVDSAIHSIASAEEVSETASPVDRF